MKDTELKGKDEVKVHAEKQQEKQLKHVGTMIPHGGHTLWELDIKTHRVTKAEFQEQYVDFVAASKGEIAHKKKVVVKDGCDYELALNLKNAVKRFRRIGYAINIHVNGC